jgi:hypothetical protein
MKELKKMEMVVFGPDILLSTLLSNSLFFVYKGASDTMLVGTLVECEADLASVGAGCVARQRPG